MRQVVVFVTVAACAAMAVLPAAAQGNTGFSVGDFVYAHEAIQKRAQATSMSAPDSPFSQLSKGSRAWIRDETRRQIETPRTPMDVVLAIDAALGDDTTELARRQRIDPQDITLAVLLLVMADAEDAASKAAKRARKAGDPTAAETAAARLTEATARRKEAFSMQSDVSMALAMM